MLNKIALLVLFFGLKINVFSGSLLAEKFPHKGLDREYEIYLPENLKENAPLVFVLHGRTSKNKWIRKHSQMNSVADKHGFAVCYPQGTNAQIPGVDKKPVSHWNVHLTYMAVDDVAFLSDLAISLQKKHKLDPKRTFAAGHSNGAHMVYTLGLERPDIFKAIASVAGWMSHDTWENRHRAKAIPVMQIHGLSDRVNPIEGSKKNRHKKGLGWGGAVHLDEVVNFWVELNQCNKNVTKMITERTRVHRYFGGKSNFEVWYYKIADWPHIWPANGYNPKNINKDGVINASEEIWKFFSKVSRSS